MIVSHGAHKQFCERYNETHSTALGAVVRHVDAVWRVETTTPGDSDSWNTMRYNGIHYKTYIHVFTYIYIYIYIVCRYRYKDIYSYGNIHPEMAFGLTLPTLD